MRAKIVPLAGLACAALAASLQLHDINGNPIQLFRARGAAEALFFVMTDCPISNSYAPEIQRICSDYGTRGVRCSLVYEDVEADTAAVQKHLAEYRYRDLPAVIDADRRIARQAKAEVTPTAVVVDFAGRIRYRGRINNFYAALGKPRQTATVHDLRDALDAVLAGRPVANPQTEPLGCYIAPADILKK